MGFMQYTEVCSYVLFGKAIEGTDLGKVPKISAHSIFLDDQFLPKSAKT